MLTDEERKEHKRATQRKYYQLHGKEAYKRRDPEKVRANGRKSKVVHHDEILAKMKADRETKIGIEVREIGRTVGESGQEVIHYSNGYSRYTDGRMVSITSEQSAVMRRINQEKNARAVEQGIIDGVAGAGHPYVKTVHEAMRVLAQEMASMALTAAYPRDRTAAIEKTIQMGELLDHSQSNQPPAAQPYHGMSLEDADRFLLVLEYTNAGMPPLRDADVIDAEARPLPDPETKEG